MVSASHFDTLCKDAWKLLEDNGHEVIFDATRSFPAYRYEELEKIIPDIDAAIIGMDLYDEKVFKIAPKLKCVCKFGVGVDNINLADATKYGVKACNCPGQNSNAVAELTVGFMIDALRGIIPLHKAMEKSTWPRYLGEEMGFNGKVDAIGNAQALDTISKAKGDGTTIMMFHDMAFLSVLFGAVSEDYALENLTVGPRIGVNPGGCFVAKADAPYNNLNEAAQWLADNPGEELRVNIESGSASHLDFVVWYMWVQEQYGDEVASRIKALVGGTTDEKKQRLWDGNTDIIYADYSSCVEFTKEGVDAQLAMKLFDTCGNLEGSGVISMADDGITFNGEPFDFNKDFFMLFPKDMDEGILNEIAAAMQKVCENPDFQAEMAGLLYSAVTAEEADLEASRQFISDKRDIGQEIIDVAPGLDELT